MKYLLGIDLGSSSIKASLVDAGSGATVAAAQSPKEEMAMKAVQPGWAEQEPDLWWEHARNAIHASLKAAKITNTDILAIGISYQMHGLVCVDKNKKVLRPSIIWCDSRAVPYGQDALVKLGETYCLGHLLNSPGNFTASKLKWVKENEPELFAKIDKIMLPGDYLAMRLTGEIVTTASGLSEGILWDFKQGKVADKLLEHYGFSASVIPPIVPTFSVQGKLLKEVADDLGLAAGTPVSYRAGDQPNNAFSLNVVNPGETAATAGTSGVIYSVTEKNAYDPKSRVNTFMHVNNDTDGAGKRNGVLLCINGTGILNSWLRKTARASGEPHDYNTINDLASKVPVGSDGLAVLPFGNGAERILENKEVGSSIEGLNFNIHSQSHLFRAAQEGIVFSLGYGFDILKNMGLETNVIRAGKANMFLSPLFREAFVNTIGAQLELYDTDGAKGAALGAGKGVGLYKTFPEAFKGLKKLHVEEPQKAKGERYAAAYSTWLKKLNDKL
ncbi:MAG TPA: FGGY family carbohydrate kinase [Cyclobacteriaceae bacterium]|nr:FGGY family carbohydrate kinase [Cyclobacteriaceae bacterium]